MLSEVFAELIEREDIRPAPYVGRYKWVMLDRLDAVPDAELEDLIQQSYKLVAAKAPKQSKPKPRKAPKSKAPTKKKSPKTRARAKRR